MYIEMYIQMSTESTMAAVIIDIVYKKYTIFIPLMVLSPYAV